MRQARPWHKAIVLFVLSLVAASSAVFAANGKPDQQAHSFTYLLNPEPETWLGVIVIDVNQAKAQELKLPGVYGAIVVSVISGGPAEKAGIKPNDVILDFAGERVWSAAQLQRTIKETPADRTVTIKISRQGMLQTLEVKIEDRGPSAFLKKPANPNFQIWEWPFYNPPAPQQPGPFLEPVPKGKILPLPPVMPKFYLGPLPNLTPQPLPEPKPFIEPGPKGKIIPLPPATPFNSPFSPQEKVLGISGDDLTPQLARFFGVKEGKGVLINGVVEGSPASAAGLKVGDVIIRVGSQQVGSMAELQQALQTQQNTNHRVSIAIVRNRQEQEMSVLLTPDRPGVKPEPIAQPAQGFS
jgi:serine protease Do